MMDLEILCQVIYNCWWDGRVGGRRQGKDVQRERGVMGWVSNGARMEGQPGDLVLAGAG